MMTTPVASGHRRAVATGRRWRWSLAGVLLLVAVSAVYGGIGLMGNGMGMPRGWLDRTPFDSWTWPGVALLITVAAPQLVAAGLAVAGHRWAPVVGLLGGAALVLWIVVQMLVLQRYFFLQPVIAGFGVVEMALAWGWLRSSRPSPV